MTIVLDANLLVVLVNQDPRKEAVAAQIDQWLAQDISLHAPDLLPYEVANALTRLIVAKHFAQDGLQTALELLSQLPINYHPLKLSPRVIEIALSLKRQNAYDAAYIALAESLNAELWTLDTPLYRNAHNLGFPVHLIEP